MSIGSSKRDHSVEINLAGERFKIGRIGTDGSLERAAAIFAEYDGKVAAFGMGGIDMYLKAAGKRYYFREAKKLKKAAGSTPVLDGSGLKGAVEAGVIRYLRDECGLEFQGKKVLVTSAVDRWGLAEALQDEGCQMVFGDLIYVLGLPFPIRRWSSLVLLVKTLAPFAAQMPFSWLYPTGGEQEREPRSEPLAERLYQWADIIAGDWQYVKKFMPRDMRGKWVITNTTTAKDVELCASRGVKLLITTTPRFEGRTFGANVIEAAFVAYAGASGELTEEEYLELLEISGFKPDVRWLGL